LTIAKAISTFYSRTLPGRFVRDPVRTMIRTEHGLPAYATVLQFWRAQPVTDVTNTRPDSYFLARTNNILVLLREVPIEPIEARLLFVIERGVESFQHRLDRLRRR
jgi:hypothetical protein